MALALGVFFLVGEYTRKARVQGVLAPVKGVVRVVAQQGGVVHDLRVVEGTRVDADGALLTIADTRASAAREDLGDAIGASLRHRRRALDLQRAHALAAMESEQATLAQRRAGLSRELAQLDAELEVQSRRLAVARAGLGRWTDLEAAGFVAAAMVDRERDLALDLEARIEATRRTRLALTRELDAAQQEALTARDSGNSQLAVVDAQRAALEQERVERGVQHRLGVVAPVRGMVATVLVEPGQVVTAGMTLATILPADARLEAHLFAPFALDRLRTHRPGCAAALPCLPAPEVRKPPGARHDHRAQPIVARRPGLHAARRQPRARLSHQGRAGVADGREPTASRSRCSRECRWRPTSCSTAAA
jgi:membrane fusion protein